MTLALLSAYDLGGVVAALVFVYGLARIRDRTFTLGFGKGSITIEDVHDKLDRIKQTVGEPNGDGDLTHMGERILAESAETKAELAALRVVLDDRTHVVRSGQSEPEELGPYAQGWFHRMDNRLTVLVGSLQMMWTAMVDHGFDLPEIPPAIEEPTPGG